MISLHDALERVPAHNIQVGLSIAPRGGSAAAAVGPERGATQHADHPIGDAGSSPAPRSQWRQFNFPSPKLWTRVQLAWCLVTQQPFSLKLIWGNHVKVRLPLSSESPIVLPGKSIVDIRFNEDQ